VFDQIDIGFRFVQSAGRATEQTVRATILTFAQRAYDSARWWIDIAPLTTDERKRARLSLDALFQEIERCQSAFDGVTDPP
jgi:hypothetical protein